MEKNVVKKSGNMIKRKGNTCAQKILHQKEDILGGKVKVKFHKTCRKTFISSQNIGYISQSSETENASSSRTRYPKDGFNIRQICLICNRSGKKGQQRLTSVHTDSTSSDSTASYNEDFQVIKENEILILHKAAGILKKKIREFHIPQSNFPNPDDMNQVEFEKQVPNELLKFVSWLIDDDCYESVNDKIIS
ncbi:unnamed protein product [Psylliodes chrysocephalus]|uniref:Uncharacterized protein n=1 Tax=Psylliodes chrysocephalus TaxID=3402493 RepID=A0A9P0C9I6_9CUCU|nr:unnamed protein product [Psylliodes chrysocephala]